MIDHIQFNSLSEFLAMGGYAFNVWSVYALFAVFLIANLALPWWRHRLILRGQKRRLAGGDQAVGGNAGWEVSAETSTAGELEAVVAASADGKVVAETKSGEKSATGDGMAGEQAENKTRE